MNHYPNPRSRSAALYERAKKSIPGGGSRAMTFVQPYPVYAASARGCAVTDVDGVERLDFINNYMVQIHGHGHPAIVEAVQRQAERAISLTLPTELEIELAEILCARTPSFERIRFANSGTEAVMVAMKAARACTGRAKIAKCEGAYHGGYDFAEVSLDPTPQNWGNDLPRSVAFTKGVPQGVLDTIVSMPFNDVEGSLRALKEHAGDIAGILVDPVPSRVGGVPASREYLGALASFAKANGSLLIFDEVVTYRLAYGGWQTRIGIEPDLTTLGKLIGGGLPIGAVAGRADAMEVFDQTLGKPAYPHSGTFNANPLTMAAGIAAMKLLTHDAIDRLNALGETARGALRAVIAASGHEGQVTGEGSLFLIHFTDARLHDYRSAYPAHSGEKGAKLTELYRQWLDNGIVASSWGLGCLSTPMGEAEIGRLAEATAAALRRLAN